MNLEKLIYFKDEINVSYILILLARYKDADEEDKESRKRKIKAHEDAKKTHYVDGHPVGKMIM